MSPIERITPQNETPVTDASKVALFYTASYINFINSPFQKKGHEKPFTYRHSLSRKKHLEIESTAGETLTLNELAGDSYLKIRVMNRTKGKRSYFFHGYSYDFDSQGVLTKKAVSWHEPRLSQRLSKFVNEKLRSEESKLRREQRIKYHIEGSMSSSAFQFEEYPFTEKEIEELKSSEAQPLPVNEEEVLEILRILKRLHDGSN